jgi:hypothetical protein
VALDPANENAVQALEKLRGSPGLRRQT